MSKERLERDAGVLAALEAANGGPLTPGASGIHELARRLGCDPAAVSRWRSVPAHRIIDVERETGVSRAILRPDLYGPREGL